MIYNLCIWNKIDWFRNFYVFVKQFIFLLKMLFSSMLKFYLFFFVFYFYFIFVYFHIYFIWYPKLHLYSYFKQFWCNIFKIDRFFSIFITIFPIYIINVSFAIESMFFLIIMIMIMKLKNLNWILLRIISKKFWKL